MAFLMAYLILAYLLPFLCFCYFDNLLRFKISSGFRSLKTSLLCIIGELARGGSVTVTVKVSDR